MRFGKSSIYLSLAGFPHKMCSALISALCFLVFTGTGAWAQSSLCDIITDQASEFTDAAGDTQTPAFDITHVSLTQHGNNLRFHMDLNSQPQPDSGCYKFLIDADSNPNTGQTRGSLGVDYFVLVCSGDVTIYNAAADEGYSMKSHILNYVAGANFIEITTDFFLADTTTITWGAECFSNQGYSDSSDAKTFSIEKDPYAARFTTSPAEYLFDVGKAYLPLDGQITLIPQIYNTNTLETLPAGPATVIESSSIIDASGATVFPSGNLLNINGPVTLSLYLQQCGLFISDDDFQLYLGDLFSGVHHEYVLPGNKFPSELFDNPDNFAYKYTIGQVLTGQDVNHITDILWEKLRDISGVDPFAINGHKTLLYFAAEACGFVAPPAYNVALGPSCIELPDASGFFQWWVPAHELGHHFALGSGSFRKITDIGQAYYAESLASIIACWAFEEMENSLSSYGLSDKAQAALLAQAYTFSHVIGPRRPRTLDALQIYEANPVFSQMSVAIFFDMFVKISNTYGPQTTRNFFKIFSTGNQNNTIFDTADTVDKKHTFMIAALSAAGNADLRDTFRAWKFPIDNVYFNNILPVLRGMATSSSSTSTTTSTTTTPPEPCTVEFFPRRLSKVINTFMQLQAFIIRGDEHASFSSANTINWGTNSVETLLQAAFDQRIIIALVLVNGNNQKVGDIYEVTVGACTGELPVHMF
jgi:hypothetical protein